jgi:hypothetical protein
LLRSRWQFNLDISKDADNLSRLFCYAWLLVTRRRIVESL